MDESRSLVSDWQAQLRKFAKDRDWEQFHSPKNLAMAIAGEVGELVEVFQWLSEDQSMSLSAEDLDRAREEIADVQIYLVRLADILGVDLDEAVRDKIERNDEKYPADLVRGTARRPTEVGE